MSQITKGHNSWSIFQNFFKSWSGHLLITTNPFTKFQGSSSNSFAKITKGHYSRSIFKISSKVNQVVYSSLPVYSSSFKALASIDFEIFCWQVKNAQNSQRAITYEIFFRIYEKVNQVIYSSLPINSPSFRSLALTVFEIFCWQGKKCPKLQRALTQ